MARLLGTEWGISDRPVTLQRLAAKLAEDGFTVREFVEGLLDARPLVDEPAARRALAAAAAQERRRAAELITALGITPDVAETWSSIKASHARATGAWWLLPRTSYECGGTCPGRVRRHTVARLPGRRSGLPRSRALACTTHTRWTTTWNSAGRWCGHRRTCRSSTAGWSRTGMALGVGHRGCAVRRGVVPGAGTQPATAR